MEWSQGFSVLIEEIDDQHKVLFDAITELEKSLLDPDIKQRWTVIHYAIVKLNDYVRIHFTVEEALMRIMQYPEAFAHRVQHKAFEAYLREVEKRSLAQDVSEEEIVNYLRNWLLTHIREDDRRYSDYFRATLQLSAV